ncbi:MAG: helix-turn-helix domain-containing protein [Spirochaetaceae bacterium]|jgi:transcriptional regulator with XRE-family HTH domain|nr:helix-turn-helix domain-containing protein [Spirochaetaceae bacterium]
MFVFYYSQLEIIVNPYKGIEEYTGFCGNLRDFGRFLPMSDCRSLLAKNMKRYREILGLSQMALAGRVGCSTTLIGNIEIKKRFPSAENLDRIAAALKISPADLFAEAETASMKTIEVKQSLKSQLEKRVLAVIGEVVDQQRVV